jgi:hypothetical protein
VVNDSPAAAGQPAARWRRRPRPGGAFAVAALVVLSTTASAQADSVGSPEWTTRTCAAAAASLSLAGVDCAAFVTGLASVQSCPDEGPVTLARLWKTPPVDSASRHALSSVSGRIRDRRLFGALVAAVSDGRLGTAARLDAIAALAAQTDSMLVVEFVEPPARQRSRGPRVQMLRLSHPIVTMGAQPLGMDVTARVVGLFEKLSTSDPDPVLRYVSGVVARNLTPTKP